MKISQLIKKVKLDPDQPVDAWELMKYYGVDKAQIKKSDLWVNWHNRNNPIGIIRMMNNKKFILASKIDLFYELFKEHNFGHTTTINEFQSHLNSPVILYRGGQGTFDKDYQGTLPFVSYTLSRDRANTFSIYDGTFAKKVYMLDKNTHYWIIELHCKLDDILLHHDVGDLEVIMPADSIKQANLIVQK
jgi:hypothetical protein